MSDDQLLRLAREREESTSGVLGSMTLVQPGLLRKHIRTLLHRQVDRRRLKKPDEGIPRLEAVPGGNNELKRESAEFESGSRLDFDIELEENKQGWLVKRFRFHLHLSPDRAIGMVRIQLNSKSSYDPLAVPRCHLHLGDSEAHVPFPIMNPLLILHLICEHIEPDIGSVRAPSA